MRDNTVLKSFETIALLQQYLYLTDGNSITFTNDMGTPIELHMTDDCRIMGINLNFPDVPPMRYDTSLTVNTWRCIIMQLEHTQAILFPGRFENRLAEITEITRSNLYLNKE